MALIILLSIFLRIYNLDKVPPALFGDELDVGYQAYSLLNSGQDLYGNSWPTLLHSLSEFRAPLFIYSAVPFVAIFGLNEWGVRLPAVFWGILGILGVFLLVQKLFNKKIALIASISLAISPWHIHYSRASFEVTMLLAFIIFATYFFIKSFDKRYLLFISAMLFGLTPYIYSTAVVFLPLFVLILLAIFKEDILKNIKIFIVAFFVMALILTPYGIQTLSGKSGERFNVVSIFTNISLQDKVFQAQKSERLPLEMQRFFHNKLLIWLQNFSLNYLRAFSPEFLFLNGDPNSRHSIHEMGQMYFYELVPLLIGVWLLLKMGKKRRNFVLGWLLIAPIPASLTYDGGFHATRNFLMLVPLMVLVAIGIDYILNNLNKPKIRCVSLALFLIFIFNLTFYLHRYFSHYPLESWRAWHFGFKEAFIYVKDNQERYDKVLINNSYEPSLIRFLFWTKYDPKKFHQEFMVDDYSGFSLDKYYFGKPQGPIENILDKKTLFVASARDDITNPETLNNANISLLKTIYSPTNEPIFYLITGQK